MTGLGQAMAQSRQQRRQAAEQPQAARYLERQGIGKIQRHRRRELPGPGRQIEQQLGLAGTIAQAQLQLG